ncbi:hypothetical protein [Cohnella sp. GCM10027633]|uniref:hypothetical protein n=1 Tax=unclassified Cohnella TaxID=2636738 RepID=UPI00363C99AA
MARVRTRKFASRNREKQPTEQSRQGGKDEKKSSGLGMASAIFGMQKAIGNQATQENMDKKKDKGKIPPPLPAAPVMTPDFGLYMSPYSQERDTQAGYGTYRAMIKETLADKEKNRASDDESDVDADSDADFEDEGAETDFEESPDDLLGYADQEPEMAEIQSRMVQERRDSVLAELKQSAEDAEQNRNLTPTEISKQLEAMERAKFALSAPAQSDAGKWNIDE